MTPDAAVELVRQSLILAVLLAAPMLIVGMVVGLLISVVQAVTQLQEQTLTFVPKVIAMVVAGIVLLPWMTNQMMEYARALFGGQ